MLKSRRLVLAILTILGIGAPPGAGRAGQPAGAPPARAQIAGSAVPEQSQAVVAPRAEAIGDRIARFHASEAAAARNLPSFAFARPPEVTGPLPAASRVRPAFSVSGGGGVEARITIEPNTSLYGTGMVGGPLLRNGRTTTCWNTDAYGYTDDTPSLYQSHPWVLAVRADGSSFGVLADTPERLVIDLTGGILFQSRGSPFPVIVVERESPQEVVSALADMTGHMPLPPKWALGYHQCRWSYTPDTKVMEIAEGFRQRHIPCDVIWMDIDYMNGFRCFTFSPKSFPNPHGLNGALHNLGFHSVWMIDPGIKKEAGYPVFDSGTAADCWVKTASGEDFTGDVWPGACVFPDFTRQATREWWAGLYRDFMATGVDGVWNDMNEPSVFNVPTKTMPEDNRHRADPDLGGPGPHARYHNVYGMLMVQATRQGIQAARPDKRPFVLSRANFIGGQRYAAAWTGDNTADWPHLEASVPMVLNLGLSGQPFSGPDIGGFARNGDSTLYARWMGFGALLPFARGHSEKGSVDKEPWAFGPRVETTCRRAIEARYRLLPYLYTLFREASVKGLPVARPVFFADPKDLALRGEDDAFLLGSDLLVAAQLAPDHSRRPALPKGVWRELDLYGGPGHEPADPDLPKLLVRGGSIIPLGPVMEFVDERPLDPLELVVCLDAEGRASGVLYEDAGDGYDYIRGDYAVTQYMAAITGEELVIRSTVLEGKRPPAQRAVSITVLPETERAAPRFSRVRGPGATN